MAVADVVRTWPDHLLLRVSGEIRNTTSGDPIEQWSYGVRLGSVRVVPATVPAEDLEGDQVHTTPLPDDSALQYWLEQQAVPAVRTLMTHLYFSKGCVVTQVGLNAMVDGGTSARYRSKAPVYSYQTGAGGWGAQIAGGAAAGMNYHHPPQISICVTTTTNVQRGLASKGRLFLPCPVVDLAPDWRLAVSQADELTTIMAAFLGKLRFGDGDDTGPSMWVPMVISPLPTGASASYTARVIKGVKVGRALDTIRTRRNALQEEYVSRPVTAWP